jgi:hypothetical protein
MAFFFRTGAIYSLYYTHYKENLKVIAFIMFGNPLIPKAHALNLAAKQLSSMDRAKLVHTIVRLGKVPNASIYNGRMLYRIFVTYLKPQVKKCYRTYFHAFVSSASLINYGLNKPEDFNENDLKIYNPQLYLQAKKEWLVRIMDLYSQRGVDFKAVQDQFAKVQKQEEAVDKIIGDKNKGQADSVIDVDRDTTDQVGHEEEEENEQHE